MRHCQLELVNIFAQSKRSLNPVVLCIACSLAAALVLSMIVG